jgi:hypothetical protein
MSWMTNKEFLIILRDKLQEIIYLIDLKIKQIEIEEQNKE